MGYYSASGAKNSRVDNVNVREQAWAGCEAGDIKRHVFNSMGFYVKSSSTENYLWRRNAGPNCHYRNGDS